MRKISSFIFLSLNGYYKSENEDISWHVHGEEGNRFSEEQLAAGNILMFGRKTFEMMHSFWPTETARSLYPIVAKGMNTAQKIVISNTLKAASWENTSILQGDVIQKIQKLKSGEGKDITILGSGEVVKTLTEAGLIDEYEFLIDPVVLGKGVSIFKNTQKKLQLQFIGSKTFEKSGAVLVRYKKAT